MRALIMAMLALALNGCAEQIMKGYVGRPLQAAMVDYGPPSNAFDMGDGRRAFQWEMTNSYTAPTFVQNRGNVTPIGNSVWWTQNTQIIGGGTSTSKCLYTLYARWDQAANVWRVEGIEKPRLECQ